MRVENFDLKPHQLTFTNQSDEKKQTKGVGAYENVWELGTGY